MGSGARPGPGPAGGGELEPPCGGASGPPRAALLQVRCFTGGVVAPGVIRMRLWVLLLRCLALVWVRPPTAHGQGKEAPDPAASLPSYSPSLYPFPLLSFFALPFLLSSPDSSSSPSLYPFPLLSFFALPFLLSSPDSSSSPSLYPFPLLSFFALPFLLSSPWSPFLLFSLICLFSFSCALLFISSLLFFLSAPLSMIS